jgi:hypothetical protein
MSRPYFQAGAKDLEALFEQHKDDLKQLLVLLDELEHRTTPKAIALKSRISKWLATKKAQEGAAHAAPLTTAAGIAFALRHGIDFQDLSWPTSE